MHVFCLRCLLHVAACNMQQRCNMQHATWQPCSNANVGRRVTSQRATSRPLSLPQLRPAPAIGDSAVVHACAAGPVPPSIVLISSDRKRTTSPETSSDGLLYIGGPRIDRRQRAGRAKGKAGGGRTQQEAHDDVHEDERGRQNEYRKERPSGVPRDAVRLHRATQQRRRSDWTGKTSECIGATGVPRTDRQTGGEARARRHAAHASAREPTDADRCDRF